MQMCLILILIKISLTFVPRGPIDNQPSLVQIMHGRPTGVTPLSEPVMDSAYVHFSVLDRSHKSHNATVPHSRIHHSKTEMCISITQWCFAGHLSDALWDLWDGSKKSPTRHSVMWKWYTDTYFNLNLRHCTNTTSQTTTTKAIQMI